MFELPAIEDITEPRLKRHRLWRDAIAAAHFGRIDVHFPGGGIDQAFHHISRLGPAGPAIRADWCRIREYGRYLDIDRRGLIGAGETAQMGARRYDAARSQISADIADAVDPDGQEVSVFIKRESGIGDLIAVMVVAQHSLAAIRGPAHRPSELLCRPEAQRMLGKLPALHAEAAADIARDDPHAGFGDMEYFLRQTAPDIEGALRSGVKYIAFFGGVIVTDADTGFHGGGCDPVYCRVQLGDVVRLGEGCIDGLLISLSMEEGFIVRTFIMDRGSANGGGGCDV